MKRLIKPLLPLLILALGVGLFVYLKQTRPEQEPAKIRERLWRVAVETLEPRRLAPVLELYGRVETPELLRAAAPAPARVARVLVREGERVEAGQLLVELDARDFAPALAQASAQVAEIQAQIESEHNRRASDRAALEQERQLLALAEDAVARAQSLTRRQVGSQTDLDQAEQELARQRLAVSTREQTLADHPARLRALEARLQNAEAQLAEARLTFERSRVVAPEAARVTAVSVSAGDQVKSESLLLELFALDSLEIRARIPAPYQNELARALADQGTLPAQALLDGEALDLTLVRLAGEAAASGLDAFFRIESERHPLRPGQLLSLRLERPAREAVVALPAGAVYGGDRVYVLSEEGRMRGVPIEPLGAWFAPDGEERLLARAPALEAGVELIVTHMPNAVEGLRVEPVR
ncbi:MAG: biotin/lipoyl-binding protein [Chromatiaceae bacterium]|nr:biotin/lipoyl-binding protein [Chromatiaceae bacterium]